MQSAMNHVLQAAQPLWDLVQPHYDRVVVQTLLPEVRQILDGLDAKLASFQPSSILILAVVATLAVVITLQALGGAWRRVQEDGGLLPALFAVFRSLPFISGAITAEKKKMRATFLAGRPQVEPMRLPEQGQSRAWVMGELRRRQQADQQVEHGASRLSGSVYMGSPDHMALMNDAFCLFAITNPLHADVWPSVRQMEAEVVAMTASMLGGGTGTSVCGAMTSGGTESILLAMKAARDWARERRGVRQPEIIIARSAHAAYIKAAEYFKMKLVVLPVGRDLRLTGRAVRSAITRNTAVVVASAPCFPHGVVDHVADIAKVCRSRRVCLHVDACLGGFVLAFARKLGRPVPAFDFSVPGVTSMSVDTHKFGLAHKGSSVVLYSSPDIRAHQFTSITDWSGGLYISPTMAGSRPGGLIATAWAAMMAQGEAGYVDLARQLMDLADRFQEGIRSIPELQLMGRPDMCLVSFTNNPKTAPRLNVYKVKDLLSRSGWSVNALQSPPALHMCFTPAHVGGDVDVAAALLADIRQACQALTEDPECVSGGSAPLYGVANVVPDRRMIGDFLVTFQECQLDL